MDERERAFYQNARKPVGEDGAKLLSRMNGGEHAELATWAFGCCTLPASGTLLDIGCGGGANIARLLELCPACTVLGLDYSSTSVDMSRELNAAALQQGRCDVVLGDVACMPFEDASVRFACAFETVYFWPDLEAGLNEVARVLECGGRLLLANTSDGLSEESFRFVDVIEGMRVYTADELSAALQRAGLAAAHVHGQPERGWLAIEAEKPA